MNNWVCISIKFLKKLLLVNSLMLVIGRIQIYIFIDLPQNINYFVYLKSYLRFAYFSSSTSTHGEIPFSIVLRYNNRLLSFNSLT